jgi:hypothetical protein
MFLYELRRIGIIPEESFPRVMVFETIGPGCEPLLRWRIWTKVNVMQFRWD